MAVAVFCKTLKYYDHALNTIYFFCKENVRQVISYGRHIAAYFMKRSGEQKGLGDCKMKKSRN